MASMSTSGTKLASLSSYELRVPASTSASNIKTKMATEPIFHDPKYSQEYILPGNTIQGRPEPLKITYADYGYRNEENPEAENVFLFFPPLLGSRWMHTAKDGIAKRFKVRIINVERPGYGGTDEVEVQDRLRVWQGAFAGNASN